MTPSQLSVIVLIGGSSRIPLVGKLLQHAFRTPTALDTHPTHDVALGALTSVSPDGTQSAPQPPPPISGPGLVSPGGERVTSVSTTVQAYDLTASNTTWRTLPSLTPPPGRHGLGVTAIGNTLYAVGGATKAGHTASTNLVAALRFS